MEKEFCTVQTGDKVKCYERGIAYKKIAEEFQEEYPAKIVLALVDGTRLQELNKRLKQDCKIEFVTVKDPIGYETYRRSLCFMLVKAVHDVGVPRDCKDDAWGGQHENGRGYGGSGQRTFHERYEKSTRRFL